MKEFTQRHIVEQIRDKNMRTTQLRNINKILFSFIYWVDTKVKNIEIYIYTRNSFRLWFKITDTSLINLNKRNYLLPKHSKIFNFYNEIFNF